MTEKYSDELFIFLAQTGPLKGEQWALRDELIIGREPTCDIIIQDRQVSRLHARLKLTQEGILLEDLSSKNGTHLNGNPIDKAIYLHDGDVVQVALAQKFVFLSSDSTIPLETDGLLSQTEYLLIKNPDKGNDIHTSNDYPALRLDSKSRRVWLRVYDDISLQGDERNILQSKEIEINPPLSASQFRLLELLYQNRGQVISRQDLITGVWGVEDAIGVSEQALDALVRRLRERISEYDSTRSHVVTVRGHGLRLDNSLSSNR